MMARPDNPIAQARPHVATAIAALSMLLFAAGIAWPQGAAPPPSLGVQDPGVQQNSPEQSEPAPSPPPEREEKPGLLNEIGKMFEKCFRP